MWLIWVALIVAAFFVGHYAGDKVMKGVADAAVFVWNWFLGLFKKK